MGWVVLSWVFVCLPQQTPRAAEGPENQGNFSPVLIPGYQTCFSCRAASEGVRGSTRLAHPRRVVWLGARGCAGGCGVCRCLCRLCMWAPRQIKGVPGVVSAVARFTLKSRIKYEVIIEVHMERGREMSPDCIQLCLGPGK